MVSNQKKYLLVNMTKSNIKKYLLYLIRWQLSTPILALVLYLFNFNEIIETILANFIGGLIFFWVDMLIFKKK